MMGWGCPGYGIGGGGWSLFGMLPGLLIFFGLLIVIALSLVWLIRRGRLTRDTAQSSDIRFDPMSIAQRRLAAGEITTAEFEEIRERIHN